MTILLDGFRTGQNEMVHSQAEAKQFFVDRVIRRALAEGLSLSDGERQMLLWSESDGGGAWDPQLVDRLASEMSDAQYEEKIAGLLERVFREDVAAHPGARHAWQHARDVLEQGDHYILVMIDQAVGARLKRWWQFWR